MSEQALQDLVVIDLTQGFGGPYATAFFAGLGAEVIKVEPPGQGDCTRSLGPFPNDEPHPEKSGAFLYLNMGKKGVTLDLSTATSQKILRELVKQADFLIETFASGTMEAWGLGYEELAELNPALVMTSLTPYGQTGPQRDWLDTDLIGLATAANIHHLGDADREPVKTGGWMSRYHTGCQTFVASMVALAYRDVSGEGQHVDVSVQECLASLTEVGFSNYLYDGTLPARANRSGHGWYIGDFGSFPTKDGSINVALPIANLTSWNRLLGLMQDPELEDPRFATPEGRVAHEQEIRTLFSRWTSARTKAEAYDEAQQNRLPFGFNATAADLAASVHLKERGYWVEADHPEAGPLTYPGSPYIMSETPWQPGRAPLLGEHNVEVYCDRLGYSKEDLVKLRNAGVI